MKHVRESLKEFNDYKFFSLFEEEKPETDKDSLKSKESDGLAIIDKITKDFEDFKKDAGGEILKFKEFWEENKKAKEGFTETGDAYKLFGSDYLVGVFELPPQTLSDGSIEGGLGATDEPEEEIIEGKELDTTPKENFFEEKQVPTNEAVEEDENRDLDLNLTDEKPVEPAKDEPTPDEISDEQPTDVPMEEPPIDSSEPTETPEEEAPVEEPTKPEVDLKAPQTYFVVYDLSGGEREEIFRCGSNNVVKAFNSFYNDTFKGSMKNAILQYKEEKLKEKTEAEKSEKQKKETEKANKVKKFLGEAEDHDSEKSLLRYMFSRKQDLPDEEYRGLQSDKVLENDDDEDEYMYEPEDRFDVIETLNTMLEGDDIDFEPLESDDPIWAKIGYPEFGENPPDDVEEFVNSLSETEFLRLREKLDDIGFITREKGFEEDEDEDEIDDTDLEGELEFEEDFEDEEFENEEDY